jgi:hypothetical protein
MADWKNVFGFLRFRISFEDALVLINYRKILAQSR